MASKVVRSIARRLGVVLAYLGDTTPTHPTGLYMVALSHLPKQRPVLEARRIDRELIFHNKGRRVCDVKKAWRGVCRDAGVKWRVPYDLRRTAVRNMIRAAVYQTVAMRISGHKTDRIFRRYKIVSESNLRDAILRTQAYVEGLPSERKVIPLASGDRIARIKARRETRTKRGQ